MNTFLRRGLGVLVGTVGASLTIMSVEAAAHYVLEEEALFAGACAALGLGAFIGGTISRWIGRHRSLPWIVGAVLAVLTMINVQSFAHPGWFVPVAMFVLAVGTFAATRLSLDRRQEA